MAKKKKVSNGLSIPTEKELAKRYPSMMIASESEDDKLPWLPSRFYALNAALGGGIQYGKALEIFGEESSGKSLMAYDFANSCLQLGGIVLWVDAEQSFMNSWAEENGLDLTRVVIYTETSIEKISDWVADMVIYYRSILVNNEPILLVMDSISALECNDNINAKQLDKKAEMGNRARAIGIYFRLRYKLLVSLGITQIYINQLRKKLTAGMFEDPDTTPGGQALKFYASLRIAMYGGKQITKKVKGKERKIGRQTSIRFIKNKLAPPASTLKGTPIYFNPKYVTQIGFEQLHFLSDILVEKEIVEKSSGGVYTYKNKTLVRGEDNFVQLLHEDPALLKRLLKKADINSIELTQSKLNKLEDNLYPIEGEIKVESQSKSEEDEYDE